MGYYVRPDRHPSPPFGGVGSIHPPRQDRTSWTECQCFYIKNFAVFVRKMVIFGRFLPRNYLQNLLFRSSLSARKLCEKGAGFANSCRVPLSRRVRYAGPSDVCGDVRGPTIGGPHGAHRPPRQGPCQRLVKPLTGGVKNLILGVVEKSQLVISLCGVAAALRRSREGDGGHT